MPLTFCSVLQFMGLPKISGLYMWSGLIVAVVLVFCLMIGRKRVSGVRLVAIRKSQLNGPLRVNPANSRYFTDDSGETIYLTGSHTWNNLVDIGFSDPPPRFDYKAYLDFLVANNHNFFRLYAWEQARGQPDSSLSARSLDDLIFEPQPYPRTGPGTARDGKPKFDLSRFNAGYFNRLRERVALAEARDIYVSVMLFNGFSIEMKDQPKGNPWPGHPFNSYNNINDIDGDSDHDGQGKETHTLQIPTITRLQEAYVRQVVDTVNGFDNVLYEISNESRPESHDWQCHMVKFIKHCEAGKTKQHPIGMTVAWPGGSNSDLIAGPADWISPNGNLEEPLASDGTKVIIDDTDHLCGICGSVSWVWKSFLRGRNPILMDFYNAAKVIGPITGLDTKDQKWDNIRRNMGYTLTFANRLNLAAMVPHGELASSEYCLANSAGKQAEYLVFIPGGGAVSVAIPAGRTLRVEWLNPLEGRLLSGATVASGSEHTFTPPFGGDAVLYLSSCSTPSGQC
jgi:hypothetical protein